VLDLELGHREVLWIAGHQTGAYAYGSGRSDALGRREPSQRIDQDSRVEQQHSR
jgi:hypothetical protein